jgi:predicted nucleotidyltransferase
VDLASPLRSVSPGLDSAVLQVLAGTESALSASQIARLAPRGTRVGQLPVLNRLVEHGLVIAEPANHGFLYRLNREHVLADPVMSIARSRTTVLERLVRAGRVLRPAPVLVSLFGSFARGDAGPDSDIDLLIITAADVALGDEWEEQVQALAQQVLAWTGNRLERVILTEDHLRKVVEAGEPIVAFWLEEAITLSGTPLSTLVRAASPAATSLRGRR